MSLLLDDDLNYMRDSIAELLPGTAYILSVTYTPDGAGGGTEAWGTAGTADCRLDAIRGGEITLGNSVQPVFTYICTLPYDTTIGDTDRLEIGSETFAVTSIDRGKSWIASLRVTLERL
jgi:hypothetical protein